jgi:hypothetical protein
MQIKVKRSQHLEHNGDLEPVLSGLSRMEGSPVVFHVSALSDA